MSSLTDIKIGLKLVYENQPYEVLKADFVRMQQRKPVMQTKIKNLINGKVLEINFKPSDKITEADLEKIKASYLYKDTDSAYFMNSENYEQFFLPLGQIKEKIMYLKEGQEINILYFDANPISIELPAKVELKVTQAPPAVRGDTAQGNVTKPVITETGLEVDTPLFVKEEDIIRINTETGKYVERV